ncbi:MAG: rhodanese-like domain-containing protein [Lachnospiraceae bacterium]
MKIETISVSLIDKLIMRNDILLIDVRSEEEFSQKHIMGSINLPLDQIDSMEIPQGKTLVIYCDRGANSLIACSRFMEKGIHAVSVVGGINAYRGRYLWIKS